MIVLSAPWRPARLAAACCAALAALTLTAAGATAARAVTATKDNVPVVTTSDGAVRGAMAGTVNEFLGLPYAAPPTGNLRWRARVPSSGNQVTRRESCRAPFCCTALLPSPLPPGGPRPRAGSSTSAATGSTSIAVEPDGPSW